MDRAEVGSMAALMAGDGEVGRLLLAHDWSSTSLGPIQGWPAPLRTAVQLMLGSRMPMFVVWGDERIVLYNDD